MGTISGNGGSTFEPRLFEPFEETVETAISDGAPCSTAILNHSKLISYPAIKVTFDGTEYICYGVLQGPGIIYGEFSTTEGPDFTNYPFALTSATQGNNVFNVVYTDTAGTHTIKVEPYDDPELANILENGKSVNAALMRLVQAFGGQPKLSDSNANLIDKIAKLVAVTSNGDGESGSVDPTSHL